MPRRWNGKLRGTGNGGLGGGATVGAGPLANGVRLGYATAGNNTGHEGDSSYAMTHPEQIKDFGYRSAHEMTVASKALIKAYYDAPLQVFGHGGSRRRNDRGAERGAAISGGLRHHRGDGNVVVSFAPYVRSDVGLVRHAQGRRELYSAGQVSGDSRRRAECLRRPGWIERWNHRQRRKSASSIRSSFSAKAAAGANCLTAPQVEAARKIYAGPVNPANKGRDLFSACIRAANSDGHSWQEARSRSGIPVDFFKYYVFKDPNWDYKTRPLNFDSDVALAERPDVAPVNAVDPDLQ